MRLAKFQKIIDVGVGKGTGDVEFHNILSSLYHIARRAQINQNLPVDHPSQQGKFGKPVIDKIRKKFPLWNSDFVEAGRQFVVSYHHRRYMRKKLDVHSGHPKSSSKSSVSAQSATSLPKRMKSSETSSQSSSSHQSSPASTRSCNQTTRAASAAPSYISISSTEYEPITNDLSTSRNDCGSQRAQPIDLAGTSLSDSSKERSTSIAISSTTTDATSSNLDLNRNQRPSPNLPAVKIFLESCSPGLGDLTPLFIDYGCDSRKYFVEVSTWSKTDIYAFLNRVACHRMANPDALVTMRPMDIELIARRCLELGKEREI